VITLNFSSYQFSVNADTSSFGELSYAQIFYDYPLTEQSDFSSLLIFSGVT